MTPDEIKTATTAINAAKEYADTLVKGTLSELGGILSDSCLMRKERARKIRPCKWIPWTTELGREGHSKLQILSRMKTHFCPMNVGLRIQTRSERSWRELPCLAGEPPQKELGLNRA